MAEALSQAPAAEAGEGDQLVLGPKRDPHYCLLTCNRQFHLTAAKLLRSVATRRASVVYEDSEAILR